VTKRKPSKRITDKAVQASEEKPFTLPTIEAKPEVDEDAWGPDGLTLKQRRFCEFYVSDAAGNGKKAARLAGYRDDNEHCLEAQATENLRKPNVRGYISRLLARQGMTPDFLKSRLAQLAQSSMDNVCSLDEFGNVVPDLKQAAEIGALGQLREITDDGEKIGAVEKIKRKVKVHDPVRAIELLLKMQGFLTEKHEVSGSIHHTHDVKHVMDRVLSDPKAHAAARQLAERMKAINDGVGRN
jgi:phage terminase small subunit